MKHLSTLTKLACVFGLICLSSCHHRKKNVWDDSNTAAHLNSLDSYWGNSFDNSMSENDFLNASNEDFVALNEDDLKFKVSDGVVPQSKLIPGESGGIPGFNAFTVANGELKEYFQTVNFGTDEYTIRDQKNLQALQKAANYLKNHPNVYVFVAGHCDARGSEAYNLALGTKRSNWVRGYLVKNGVSPDQVFTISFGKEKPLSSGNSPNDWAKNRRAEFKIYSKN